LHDAQRTNIDGQSVAMILAGCNIVAGFDWLHTPKLLDYAGNTVGSLLRGNNVSNRGLWDRDVYP
jgi:hypothetical protein